MDGEVLAQVVDLPASLRGCKVEVVVSPAREVPLWQEKHLPQIPLPNIQLEDGRHLVFATPITLCPQLGEDKCFFAEVEEFGMRLRGEDFNALIKDFRDNMACAWAQYVCTPEETLGPQALALRKTLLSLVSEKKPPAQNT